MTPETMSRNGVLTISLKFVYQELKRKYSKKDL